MKKEGRVNYISKKSGQVWIETVLYTLIGLLMIGLVLYYAVPTIEQAKDEALISQSTLMLEEINSMIIRMGPPGSQDTIDLWIKEGELVINGSNNGDNLIFKMETTKLASEEGLEVGVGSVNMTATKKNDISLVELALNYSGKYNITIDGEDKVKTLSKASTPYNLLITNNGKGGTDLLQIDLSVE